MVRDKLSTEKTRIAAPFIGKWIILTITISDVNTSEYFGEIEDYDSGILTGQESHQFRCRFSPEWNDRLSLLAKGQIVIITGKIENINSYGIDLTECELTS